MAPEGNRARHAGPPNDAIAPDWIYQQPERFVPFRDASGHGPEWAALWLVDYATHGGQPLAAARAGVTMQTVERHALADPLFAEERRRALDYHRALLEWESLNLGRRKHSPLPFFDRLKAELPARHVERMLVASLTLAPPPDDEAAELVRVLVGLPKEEFAEAVRLALGPPGRPENAVDEGTVPWVPPPVIDDPADGRVPPVVRFRIPPLGERVLAEGERPDPPRRP